MAGKKSTRGALHRQLHIPQDQGIPTEKLDEILEKRQGSHIRSHGHSVPVTPLLQQRARFARSFR